MREYSPNIEGLSNFNSENSEKATLPERLKDKLRTIKETLELATRLGILAALFSQLSMYGHENVYAKGMEPAVIEPVKVEKKIQKPKTVGGCHTRKSSKRTI
jgi:hypothetical protein